MKKTETTVLVDAMLVLSREIQSGDGVANAAIAEAAQRLSDLHVEVEHLRERLAYGDHEAVKLFAHAVNKGHRYVLCIEPHEGGSLMRMDNLNTDRETARMLARHARRAREDARWPGDGQ